MILASFILLFVFLNLFAGGKIQPVLRQHGGPLPGRGIYYSSLAALLILTPHYGWPGAVTALSFLIWRIPSWYGSIDAGLDPYNPERDKFYLENQRVRDFAVMSFRGLFCFPIFAFMAGADHSVLPILTLFMASLLHGAIYDFCLRSLHRNSLMAEVLSGATWGAAFYAVIG